MLAPMLVLAAACLFIGLAAPLVASVLDAAVLAWTGDGTAVTLDRVAPLVWVSAASAALLLAIAIAWAWIAARTRAARRDVGTWDCGYAAPSARMQYSASSFAQMLVALLGWALRPTVHAPRLEGPFPGAAAFESRVPDTVLERVVAPSFERIGRVAAWLRPIQRGSVHLYLVYILATLLALLLWS
jgi:hydrogenase-4 component B